MQQAEIAAAGQRGITPQTVTVTFDKRTNSLIIAGTNRQYEQVKGLVERLESARPATGERRIFVVPLRNMDPNQAKQILEQLLPSGQSYLGPSPRFLPGLRDEVGFMLYSLAMGQPAREKRVTSKPVTTRKSPLVGKDPDRAMRMALLQQMIKAQKQANRGKQQKSPAAGSPAPVTTAPTTRGTEKRFPKTIVQKGATPKAGTGVETTTAEARDLQTLASKVQGSVEITAVPDQNALIVDASEQDYQVIEQLLNMLDKSRPSAKVEIFRLKNARATELADVVGRLFANRPIPKGYPPITLTPDTATNSIIVSASPEMIDEIRQVVTQLDAQEQVPEMDFRV